MSQLPSPLRHPVVACVDGIEELLDGVADLDPGYLSTPDKADVLVRLTTLVDRVEGLRLRVMATAMDVADVEGARRWRPGWHRAPEHDDPVAARPRTCWRVGWTAAGSSSARESNAGTVSLAQAEVIVRALEALDAPSVGERGRPRVAGEGRAAPGRAGRRLHPTGIADPGRADPGGDLPRAVRRHRTQGVAGRRTTGLRGDPIDPARPRRRLRRPTSPDPGSLSSPAADLPGSVHRTPAHRHPSTGGAWCGAGCRVGLGGSGCTGPGCAGRGC